MMTSSARNPILSKRQGLALSLCAVAAYWAYEVASLDADQSIPAEFSDLVLLVIRNKLMMFASILVLVYADGSRLKDIGLSKDRGWKHFGVGLIYGLLMFVVLNVGLTTLLNSFLPSPPQHGPSIMSFFSNPTNLWIWLPIGIFGGGIVEELERIFVLTRFELWLGRWGLILAIVLSSAMFGLGHLYQGYGNALSTLVSGLTFSLLYLRRRSAIEPMTAHAFSDVLAMMAAMILSR
jgi:membrane protease YdiL (CAAX protease family)